jgi:hypothetical protein
MAEYYFGNDLFPGAFLVLPAGLSGLLVFVRCRAWRRRR